MLTAFDCTYCRLFSCCSSPLPGTKYLITVTYFLKVHMARSTNRVRDMKKEEKKKTTGHAALLWLLFSVQSGKREQRAALPLTMALQWIQIIKILVQNLASTCKGEHQMYQKFDKMVSGLCLVTINLSTSYLLKQGLSGYTERTKRLHQLSRK